MAAPSTTQFRDAMASGGSPRYSPHFSKSTFVTRAVDRSSRTLISLNSKLAAWGDSVLPHLKLEPCTRWVIMNLTGGKFHATLTSAFLGASEGSNRPPPSQ